MLFFPTLKKYTHHLRWAKWLLGAVLALALIVCTIVLTLPYSLPYLLAQQDIQLRFEQPRWQSNGFSAKHTSLHYQQQQLDIEQLQLSWNWFTPSLEQISAHRISGLINPDSFSEQDQQQSDSTTEELTPYLKLLPKNLHIEQIDLQISNYGTLTGQLSIAAEHSQKLWQPDHLDANLRIEQLKGDWLESIAPIYHPEHISLRAYSLESSKQNDAIQVLAVELHSEGVSQAHFNGVLSLDTSAKQWRAQLEQSDLQIHLANWQFNQLQAQQITAHIEKATLMAQQDNLAQLQLHIPITASIKALQHPELHPQDWQLEGVISGTLDTLSAQMQLNGSHGIKFTSQTTWQQQQLNASLELASLNLQRNNPLAKTLTAWPKNYQISQGNYQTKLDFHCADQRATGQLLASANNVSATYAGRKIKGLNLKLNAESSLEHAEDWANWNATFNNTGVSFVIDSYQHDSTVLEHLAGGLILQAQINQHDMHLWLSHPATITSQKNQLIDDLSSQSFSTTLKRFDIQGAHSTPEQLKVSANLDAELKKLRSKTLTPQNWMLDANLTGTFDKFNANVNLRSEHGFKLDNQLQGNLDKFSLHSQLQEIDFAQHNPIKKTLRDWPELLDLHRGTASYELKLNYRNNAPLTATLSSSARHLNGIYNSSELTDVSIELAATLKGDMLTAQLPVFSIKQVNPGVPLSNININSASYKTNINDPASGTLAWQSLFAQLLNGNLYVDQHSIKLNQDSSVLIDIQGLELQQLMKAYPTDGLAGNGTIDGQIPLIVNLDGVRIDQGKLEARNPGTLRFRSAELQAMAKNNPALGLLNQALDDFHFEVLKSDLNFDKDGKLILHIRLEGNNPEFENGRPVHLNFNLEQNLFALLASIQLNNHVSDLIIKRIRQRVEKQQTRY